MKMNEKIDYEEINRIALNTTFNEILDELQCDNVKIILEGGIGYTGFIKNVDKNFVLITDKFNAEVAIQKSKIITITVLKED